MNRYRVAILVMVMMVISIFAFVSQGEELPKVIEIENVGFEFEIAKIEFDTEMQRARNTLLENETNNIEPNQFVESEKMASYFSTKAEEAALTHNNRIDEILRLTPLDEYTAGIVLEYADKYSVRPSLILGVMDLESNFNQYLVGTSADRGYMQIIPGTEKWLATAFGEELGLTYDPQRIFDADYNIPLAVKYLSLLLDQYDNDTKALTSYNRGDYGMSKWFKEHGTYETAYSRVVLKREQKYLTVK